MFLSIHITVYRGTHTVSGALEILQVEREDVLEFLAVGTHSGGTNLDFQMGRYLCKRHSDGVYIKSVRRTREKLLLTAPAITAIEDPADVISSRNPWASQPC